jgi:GT2 family glycosyltransferase
MANIKYNVTVVTVTYGDRWQLLSQVVKKLLSFDIVHQIIVVNNASLYNVKNNINQLNNNRLTIIDFAENLGSAGGYKAGIASAYKTPGTDFIWLLDDDNLPDDDALDLLIQAWDKMGAVNNQTALFCLRPERPLDIKFARGENPYRYYLVPDNFLGFTFLRMGYYKWLKIKDLFVTNKTFKKQVKVPYVSYGGFFFNKAMVDKIGYPDERFFLYVDDAEYTYRVTETGGTIWLIPASRITDIDVTAGYAAKNKIFSSVILDHWSFRTYYQIRNGVYFYKRASVKRLLIYNINKFFYMLKIKLLSIIGSKQNEYKKFAAAVNNGLKGNLGKVDPDHF